MFSPSLFRILQEVVGKSVARTRKFTNFRVLFSQVLATCSFSPMAPNFLKIRSESSGLPLATEQTLFFNRHNRRTGKHCAKPYEARCGSLEGFFYAMLCVPDRHLTGAVPQPSGWLFEWIYELVTGSAGVLHMRRANDVRRVFLPDARTVCMRLRFASY